MTKIGNGKADYALNSPNDRGPGSLHEYILNAVLARGNERFIHGSTEVDVQSIEKEQRLINVLQGSEDQLNDVSPGNKTWVYVSDDPKDMENVLRELEGVLNRLRQREHFDNHGLSYAVMAMLTPLLAAHSWDKYNLARYAPTVFLQDYGGPIMWVAAAVSFVLVAGVHSVFIKPSEVFDDEDLNTLAHFKNDALAPIHGEKTLEDGEILNCELDTGYANGNTLRSALYLLPVNGKIRMVLAMDFN